MDILDDALIVQSDSLYSRVVLKTVYACIVVHRQLVNASSIQAARNYYVCLNGRKFTSASPIHCTLIKLIDIEFHRNIFIIFI